MLQHVSTARRTEVIFDLQLPERDLRHVGAKDDLWTTKDQIPCCIAAEEVVPTRFLKSPGLPSSNARQLWNAPRRVVMMERLALDLSSPAKFCVVTPVSQVCFLGYASAVQAAHTTARTPCGLRALLTSCQHSFDWQELARTKIELITKRRRTLGEQCCW